MSSDPRAVTCPKGTGTIERHVRIDDVKAHINKLGSPYLTGLVAWHLITLLDRGNCEGILVIADELLQIPIPEIDGKKVNNESVLTSLWNDELNNLSKKRES